MGQLGAFPKCLHTTGRTQLSEYRWPQQVRSAVPDPGNPQSRTAFQVPSLDLQHNRRFTRFKILFFFFPLLIWIVLKLLYLYAPRKLKHDISPSKNYRAFLDQYLNALECSPLPAFLFQQCLPSIFFFFFSPSTIPPYFFNLTDIRGLCPVLPSIFLFCTACTPLRIW